MANDPKNLEEAKDALEELDNNYYTACDLIEHAENIQRYGDDLNWEEMLKTGYEVMRQKLLDMISAFENLSVLGETS